MNIETLETIQNVAIGAFIAIVIGSFLTGFVSCASEHSQRISVHDCITKFEKIATTSEDVKKITESCEDSMNSNNGLKPQ